MEFRFRKTSSGKIDSLTLGDSAPFFNWHGIAISLIPLGGWGKGDCSNPTLPSHLYSLGWQWAPPFLSTPFSFGSIAVGEGAFGKRGEGSKMGMGNNLGAFIVWNSSPQALSPL